MLVLLMQMESGSDRRFLNLEGMASRTSVFSLFSRVCFRSPRILDLRCSLGCLLSYVGGLISDPTSATVYRIQNFHATKDVD